MNRKVRVFLIMGLVFITCMLFMSNIESHGQSGTQIAAASANGNIAVNSTITLQIVVMNHDGSARTRDYGMVIPSGLTNLSATLVKSITIQAESIRIVNFTIKILSKGDFEILFYEIIGGSLGSYHIDHLLVESFPSSLPANIIINESININTTIPITLNNTVYVNINATVPVHVEEVIYINSSLSVLVNATIPVQINTTVPVHINNTVQVHVNNTIPVYATVNVSNIINNLNNISTFCNNTVYNNIANNITNTIYNFVYPNITNIVYNQFLANITNYIFNTFVANITNQFIANVTNIVYNTFIANITNLVMNNLIANFTQYSNISQIQYQWQWQNVTVIVNPAGLGQDALLLSLAGAGILGVFFMGAAPQAILKKQKGKQGSYEFEKDAYGIPIFDGRFKFGLAALIMAASVAALVFFGLPQIFGSNIVLAVVWGFILGAMIFVGVLSLNHPLTLLALIPLTDIALWLWNWIAGLIGLCIILGVLIFWIIYSRRGTGSYQPPVPKQPKGSRVGLPSF